MYQIIDKNINLEKKYQYFVIYDDTSVHIDRIFVDSDVYEKYDVGDNVNLKFKFNFKDMVYKPYID